MVSNQAVAAGAVRFEMDYWSPDPALIGLVSGYHRYAVDPGKGQRHIDVFYPGWANLRFQVSGDRWAVRIGERCFDPVPRAAIFGPTSSSLVSDSGVGVVIGAGLTPMGWRRLSATAAADVADQIVPLVTVVNDGGALADQLAGASGKDIADRFDAFFLQRLAEIPRDEPLVQALHRCLATGSLRNVTALAQTLDVSERTLNRVALTAFGFGPKLLLRRTRFLRSLLAIRQGSDAAWATLIDPSYHDLSHFIRDSHDFLGMPPGEFLRLAKPLNDASTRLRHDVLGAPAQALAG